MRYSYEFKLMCVELYHLGSYPDIPEGLNPDTLKSQIREWSRMVDLHGPEVLKHRVFNKLWTPEEKLELVSKVIAGIPSKKVAIEAGISTGMLYQWVHKYKLQGYNGLVESKKGRPAKEPRMKKSTNPLPLTESEREELIRLETNRRYILIITNIGHSGIKPGCGRSFIPVCHLSMRSSQIVLNSVTMRICDI